MSGLHQDTPISVAALNGNIDADLELGATHGLKTDWIDTYGLFGPLTLKQGAATIARDVDNGALVIWGGTSANGAVLTLMGRNNTGTFKVGVTDAGFLYQDVLTIAGATATPYLSLNTFRIGNIGQATIDMDAAPQTKMWGAWTPTLTWGGGTPTGITRVSRYCQIGKTVYFMFQLDATDSNACSSLVISLPVNMRNTTDVYSVSGLEGYAAGGGTWIVLQAILNNHNISFINFQTATDNQAVYIRVSGFYEVP